MIKTRLFGKRKNYYWKIKPLHKQLQSHLYISKGSCKGHNKSMVGPSLCSSPIESAPKQVWKLMSDVALCKIFCPVWEPHSCFTSHKDTGPWYSLLVAIPPVNIILKTEQMQKQSVLKVYIIPSFCTINSIFDVGKKRENKTNLSSSSIKATL